MLIGEREAFYGKSAKRIKPGSRSPGKRRKKQEKRVLPRKTIARASFSIPNKASSWTQGEESGTRRGDERFAHSGNRGINRIKAPR